MTSTNPQVDGRGAMAAAISTSMVSLLHRYTGRGPTRARTTIDENVIVCVLGATLTKGERSLVEGGDQEVVLESRRAFQRLMRDDAIASLQELCGRRVVAFISGNHIEPDLAVEVFILEPLADDEEFGVDGDGAVLDGHRS
jgi:uncharacterized protein YbcI